MRYPPLAGLHRGVAEETDGSWLREQVQAPACPSCGALTGRISVRAVLPQPIAAGVLRSRALTPREHAVFLLLGFGYDNRSIARELRVSERTVKRYVTAILAKLQLESRLQAGLAALIISSARPAGLAWPEGLMDFASHAE
jgi:DNA-binding CsgD family transcriptional regulator